MLNITEWIIAALLLVIILILIFKKKSIMGPIGSSESAGKAADEHIPANFERGSYGQVRQEVRSFQQRLPIAKKPVIRVPISPPKPTVVITVKKPEMKTTGDQKLIGKFKPKP